MSPTLDAVVVGSGPNGLAAAITLARAGRSVRVYEAEATVGGGLRSAELTLPGFRHDLCSAVHPLARSSPFFRWAGLEDYGLEWCEPDVQLAHPLDDGTAVALWRDIAATADGLGADARAYTRLMGPFVDAWPALMQATLGPVTRVPRHPLLLARFGAVALRSAESVARRTFAGERARALFAGHATHAALPLDRLFTASFGIILGAAGHAVGWPVARGGSQQIADAMVRCLTAHGGEVVTSSPIDDIDQLPPAGAYVFDVTPDQLLRIAGDRFGGRFGEFYRRQLGRYRRGSAVFKLDYALSEPVPWTTPECRRAGTVHVGGTLSEIARAEHDVGAGRVPDRPFVIAAQQSVVDDTRAPAGRHTLWAYGHVPFGCEVDMTDAVERQIERFAPGFKDVVLARVTTPPAGIAARNRNNVGGDIGGGSHDGLQLFFRPAVRWNPYATPDPRIFLCSSSTPPGAGVHGMCGYWAARAVLRGLAGPRAGAI